MERSTTTPRTMLDPRRNSLNLIRLVLAFLVLVAHAYPIAGAGDGPVVADENLGGWAVIGFFALSGYLIMGSRQRTTFATFLGHRVARIFPAFLGCLIVVALVFAPVAYLIEHGDLTGFLTTPNTPANYVFANSGLRMSDYSIAGTLADNPLPGAWNGSLWTLYFEFLCYLVVGVAACAAVVRRTPWAIGALFLLSVVVRANNDRLLALFGGNLDAQWLFKLLPYFLAGALVYMVRERIPLRWWVAVPAALVTAVTVAVVPFWGGQLMAPCVTVFLLWLGRVIPSPAWIRKNDLSYGLYVYAFPCQQLATLLGVHELGVAVHILVTLPAAMLLAAASWFWLERPVLRSAKRGTSVGTVPDVATVAAPSAISDDQPATQTQAFRG